MQSLLLKVLYLFAALRYPRYKGDLRYFVRDNFYARLSQLPFFIRDYAQKKPYKVIDFQGEFEHELRYVLPFTYWHYLNGTLKQTISCQATKPFYFFSENHTEKYTKRIWQDGYGNYNFPNMTHSPSFDYSKWVPVPFKKHYQNDLFRYDKPLLVIANKYNIEWDKPPINFLSIDALDRIVSTCKHTYQIVYNRPLSTQIIGDNSEIMDLNEHEWLRQQHPEVLLMNDLYQTHSDKLMNFNQLQLMVYANADRFISMHGGTAALASYFGGINIILSHPGGGFEHYFDEYSTIFPAFSGAKILHAKCADDVFEYVNRYF
ncbi:hypothetical protein [Spirosoma montaniterrae]|uniref:Glycosyltransferase family 61 protein n=1 Tax=Spirosoma montaniterrae TaxID=1178516 RepID=A0A1P9X4I3_9BACT|nr:hypothetical protein [Spirosoma montaniterrae]AQG82539.1 hypothetical protein AWR27_16500 [Spirosoma montaniterrae]